MVTAATPDSDPGDGNMPDEEPRDPERVRVRQLLLAAAAALLLSGLLAFALIGSSKNTPARKLTVPQTSLPHVTSACVVQKLPYGLSTDPEQARQYEQEMLLGAHPELPHAGFYPDGGAPDPQALLHALAHGQVIVKYRSTLPSAQQTQLRQWAQQPAQTKRSFIVVSGGPELPVALGAVTYGRRVNCRSFGAAQLAALSQVQAAGRFLRPDDSPQ